MACYLQLQRVMGQQSLSGFLGLHVDIDRVSQDNMKKQGTRKYGCVLVNQGDKMTKERKVELVKQNQEKYGLSQEYIDYLKLPKSCNVKVYEIDKIMNSRRKLSTSEKIQYLQEIKEALLQKKNILSQGKKILDFTYLTPQEFERKQQKGSQIIENSQIIDQKPDKDQYSDSLSEPEGDQEETKVPQPRVKVWTPKEIPTKSNKNQKKKQVDKIPSKLFTMKRAKATLKRKQKGKLIQQTQSSDD